MNTRVSITTNGPIHLGHVYTILLNEQVAHNSGGKFHIRFDDGQPYWIQKLGMKVQRDTAAGIRADLDWLGVPVDSWTSEHDHTWQVRHHVLRVLAKPGHEFAPMVGTVEDDYRQALYRSIAEPNKALYPYAPWLTVEKVAWDNQQRITHVIRGDELMTEASLYAFVCQWLGWPVPEQIFIPRLRTEDGCDLSDISKTQGNWKILRLRALEWTPMLVRSRLALSCLKNQVAGWTIENVLPSPILVDAERSA